MIQIVKKRKGILFLNIGKLKELKDIPTLFKNAKKIAEKIPKKERYNIYYTLGHHKEGLRNVRAGSFIKQEVIFFDIDGIKNLSPQGGAKYIKPVCDALQLDKDKTGIVMSGNGLHFVIQVCTITNDEYFENMRPTYKQACKLITKALKKNNLEGTCDDTIFDAARILRLPFTENRKEEVKQCVMLQNNVERQELNIEMPEEVIVDTKESLSSNEYGKTDIKSVLEECLFIKWCKEHPEKIHEPHLYALMSITCRFHDNNKTTKELFDTFSSPSIDAMDVDAKIEHVIEAAPPRTCKNIENLWDGCNKCIHYKKIKSPITIKGEDFIATEEIGFTTLGAKGGITRHYDDLLKHFDILHKHKSVGAMGKIYIFNGTHYETTCESEIKNFALLKFDPSPKAVERNEFYNLVKESNYTPDSFLNSQTEGYINFKNGFLDIQTGKLKKHTHKMPFFYCLPFDYEPKALCPNWEKFIKEITLNRECLANILHEYLGYIIAGGSYIHHGALILSGAGKNGKTTFINIIRKLVGDENFSDVSITDISNDRFAVASLHGKLVNFSEEEPPSCFKETGKFKTITGNSMTTAQYKYGNTFQMKNKAKLVISYNELPYIGDTSIGMKRRMHIIPCDLNLDATPDKVDIDIEDKLAKELSGIINIALNGWHRLKQQKRFTKSEFTTQALEEVMQHSDMVYSFLKEKTEEANENTYVKFNDLYNSYCSYNTQWGAGKNITKNSFSRRLKQKNMVTHVKKIKNTPIRIVYSIKIKNTENKEKKF